MQNEELYVFIFGIFNKKMAILIFLHLLFIACIL